jgi:hypothetical protein
MALITQERALQALESHLVGFQDAMLDAWATWQRDLQSAFQPTRRTRASAVHDLIVDNVRRKVPGAIERPIRGLNAFVIDDFIAIRFKKLDGELEPSNIATHQVAQFRNQEDIEGLPAFHHLEIGYVLDELQTRIESTHLICPSGPKSHSWAMDLGEYVRSQRIVGAPGLVLPFAKEVPPTEAKPVKFRLKPTGVQQDDDEQNNQS